MADEAALVEAVGVSVVAVVEGTIVLVVAEDPLEEEVGVDHRRSTALQVNMDHQGRL